MAASSQDAASPGDGCRKFAQLSGQIQNGVRLIKNEGSGEWKTSWTRSRAANRPVPDTQKGTRKRTKSAAKWPPTCVRWPSFKAGDTPWLIDATWSVIILSTMAVRMDNSSSSNPRNKINYNKVTVGFLLCLASFAPPFFCQPYGSVRSSNSLSMFFRSWKLFSSLVIFTSRESNQRWF